MKSSLEIFLTQAWQKRGFTAYALLPLAAVYGLVSVLRRLLYRCGILRSARLPVPVLVVGNIYVGGTGKTPFVIWLVEALRARGLHPAVIARGYGGSQRSMGEVSPNSLPAEVGDEPVLVALRCAVPVWVGRHRVQVVRALLKAHPQTDLIISDDGLQHYAMQRTLEILLSDGRGNGNGWLLPAGPLREPVGRAADWYVINGGESLLPERYGMQLAALHCERLGDRTQRRSLSGLGQSERVLAAAGIGHPQRFFTMLSECGVSLDASLALPDHHDFLDQPFADLPADLILITEKDAVKCAGIPALAADPRIWVVPVSAVIDERLADDILERLRGQAIA